MGDVRLVRGGVCSARGPYQRDERIFVYEIPNVPHFEVEIGRPYLPYGRHIAELLFNLMLLVLCVAFRRAKTSGGVTHQPSTCTISHVMPTRGGGEAAHPDEYT
jgi:hypothetical protein